MRFLYVLDTVINIDKLDGFDTKFDNLIKSPESGGTFSNLFESLFEETENKKKLPNILTIRAIVGGNTYKLFDLKTSAFVPQLEIESEQEYEVLIVTMRALALSIITDIINKIKQTSNEDVIYDFKESYKDNFEELYTHFSSILNN